MTSNVKQLCALLLWLGAVVFTSAQVDPNQGKYPPDYDTNYIQDFRHRLNLSFVTEVKVNGIGIKTPDSGVLVYLTNMAVPQYGFMASYRWLNLQLTLPIPGISFVHPDRGETDALALAVGFTSRKFYARAFYERFIGYFINNPQIIFPGFPPDQTLIFPDMTSQTIYGTVYFGPNGRKYSHRSLLWQSEIQKKSAGSVLLGLTGGLKLITSPDDILPDPIPTDANRARYIVLGINAGYAYTFVLAKHLNTSLAVIPGLNYVWGSYSQNDSKEVFFNHDFGINAEARWQLLYEHENYYAGISFTTYFLTDFIVQDYPVGSAHNYLKINFGYRFKVKPVKFLKPFHLSN